MRHYSFMTLKQLIEEARVAWNSADALDMILQVLNRKKNPEAMELKRKVEVQLRALRTRDNSRATLPKAGEARVKAASGKTTPNSNPAGKASHQASPPKGAPADQLLQRIKPIPVRDYCVVDAPGMNSVSMHSTGEAGSKSAEVLSSTLPNVPSCIILPGLPRDPIVAGEEALRRHQGIGESWPPDAILRPTRGLPGNGAADTSVPDRRLLLYRCWDGLNSSAPVSSTRGDDSKKSHRTGPVIFDWERVDAAGAHGQLSASDGIAHESLAASRRHSKKQPGHFVLLIPEFLDDLSQQGLLNSLCHILGTASSSVRLLWRSIAYALDWLDGLPNDAPAPAALLLLEAQPSGLVLRQFAVREFDVGGKRVLCPVRRTEGISHPSIDSTQGLLQLAVGESPSMDAALALRDLYLGRVAFFEHGLGAHPVGQELESIPNLAGIQFRTPEEPRAPQLGRLGAELGKLVKQVPAASTLLVFGVVAKEVSQALIFQGVRHHLRSPEQGVRGGSVFMERVRKGWPTYLDELPALDLFVLKNRHRHWEPLIPEGTEVFGQEEYIHELRACASVGRGNKALNSYLRRQGHASLRYLETKLPQPPQDDEPCDLRVTASSAGGLAVIEAIPKRNRRVFGESETLTLDWDSMQEALPELDGWPKVPYTHGYPKCGEIFSSQPLFQNLLTQLRELSGVCARSDWRRADDLIGRMLVGAARASTPIGTARQEIQQMAPIGSLRPAGTRAPANFLDTSLPADRCIIAAGWHLHNPMKEVVSELLAVHGELVSGSARANDSKRHTADRLFELLTWLGGYLPEELLPRLREATQQSANSTNLTALGRCGRAPEDAVLLLKLLVADKLGYRPDGRGTTNYLKCFIYLSFQHEGVLQNCNREQLRILVEHATYILETETEAGKFKTSFVNALRTIALALRYRQYVKSGPQFLLCEGEDAPVSGRGFPGLFDNSEVGAARRSLQALDAALTALKSKAEVTRRRDGAYRPVDDRKIKLVSRVKEWVEWKAPTDIWIGGLDDDGDDDDGN